MASVINNPFLFQWVEKWTTAITFETCSVSTRLLNRQNPAHSQVLVAILSLGER